jgi:hypothetical protein
MFLRQLAVTSLLFGFGLWSHPVTAQLIHTSTPFQNVESSYFETNSIGWSLRGRNWFANFGGQGPLLPPFSAATPGGGVSGGLGTAGGGVSGSLRFNFSQGSSQSISSTTPSLTTMNGFPGSISSGVVRPFVTGFTPVVGDYAAAVNPLRATARTAAQIGQRQLSELRRSQAVLQNKKLELYLQRAERAESEGNKRMARANYRSAIAISPQPLRSLLQQRLHAMMQKPSRK